MSRVLFFVSLLFFFYPNSIFSIDFLLPGVRDQAAFFKAPALGKASDTIQLIRKELGVDITIETYKTTPPSSKPTKAGEQEFDLSDPKIAAWTKSRSDRINPNGIYVLIFKKPSYVLVAIGSELRRRGDFLDADRDRLASVFAQNFSQLKFDDALMESIQFTRNSVLNNRNPKAARTPGDVTNPQLLALAKWFAISLAAFAIIWAAIKLLPRLSHYLD